MSHTQLCGCLRWACTWPKGTKKHSQMSTGFWTLAVNRTHRHFLRTCDVPGFGNWTWGSNDVRDTGNNWQTSSWHGKWHGRGKPKTNQLRKNYFQTEGVKVALTFTISKLKWMCVYIHTYVRTYVRTCVSHNDWNWWLPKADGKGITYDAFRPHNQFCEDGTVISIWDYRWGNGSVRRTKWYVEL